MLHGDISAFFPVEFMYQNHEDNRLPSSTPQSAACVAEDFHAGVSSAPMRRSMSFSGVDRSEEMPIDDDMSDDSAPLGEKKKRLNLEQVKALEKSFELGNKLELERKMQLARALGLQPRQVAIWFQNRRARWKTKQMEKDYEALKRQLELLKSDNEILRTQNKQFHSELLALQRKELSGQGAINLNKENEASWSNGSENNIDVNLGTTGTSVESGLNTNYHPREKQMFPPSILGQPKFTHVLQGSLRQDLQGTRIDQTTSDEGLCNMFNSIEEQPSFWPWPEQQNFH